MSFARCACTPDDWHSGNCECLVCAFVEVELVAVVAAESGNVVGLERPLSFWGTGYGATTSRAVEEEFLPWLEGLVDGIFKIGLAGVVGTFVAAIGPRSCGCQSRSTTPVLSPTRDCASSKPSVVEDRVLLQLSLLRQCWDRPARI